MVLGGDMTQSFTFSNFRLDIRTRELSRDGERMALAVVAFDCLAYLVQHRDRPVGRDELISAVWGRTDVSESTLAHTIVRLRQRLGDTGNDQRYIRTIPRLGYRWVAPIVETSVDADITDAVPESIAMASADVPDADAPPDATPDAEVPSVAAGERPDAVSHRRRWIVLGLLCAFLISGVIGFMLLRSSDTPSAMSSIEGDGASSRAMGAVMVEPARVVAPEIWSWLRLGTMDLVANRLREGTLPTLPSESVLILADRSPGGFPAGVSMRVRPSVTRDGDGWRVRLDATMADGRTLRADAQGTEVMQVARVAADRLLVALGKKVPVDGTLPDDIGTLQQRIAAARLGGRLQEALALFEQAPATWRARPELMLVEARIHCDMGHYDRCRERLDTLAAKVSRRENPDLYGQLRVTQAWLCVNRDGDFVQANAFLDEVIASKAQLAWSEALGNAYSLRGWMRTDKRPDEAVSDLGQARAIFLRRGNLREIARVDQRMGQVLGFQGKMAAALASLRAADRQFEHLGARGDQVITQMAMVQIYAQLLQHDDALATADRYWSDEAARYDGAAAIRAWALMRKGRLSEAESLVASVMDRAGAPAPVWVRADLFALSARISVARGRYVEAARFAERARLLYPPDGDRLDYLNNGLVEIRALRAAGEHEAAARVAGRLQTWAGVSSEERIQVTVSLLLAEQAWAEGRKPEAMIGYARALAGAEHLGIPEVLVDVGSSYAAVLIASGRLDAASEVSARLAAWSHDDVRAAFVQARMLQALGNEAAARAAYREAADLAGEGMPGSTGSPFAPVTIALDEEESGQRDR